MEQLYYPHGVTVGDKTVNIYIADCYINCGKVFDSTGKYLYKFGDNEGQGKMCYPRGVAICEDGILITQENHCILNYELNGKFISRIGREGKGESMNQMEIYISVIITTIVSRYCPKNSLSNLNLVKMHSKTLMMLNSPKNTFMFSMNLFVVSISSAIISFYRRVLFLVELICQHLIHATSLLIFRIIFSFQIEHLILFISTVPNSSCFIRFQYLTLQREFQWILKED